MLDTVFIFSDIVRIFNTMSKEFQANSDKVSEKTLLSCHIQCVVAGLAAMYNKIFC